jgi:hypothetical protein
MTAETETKQPEEMTVAELRAELKDAGAAAPKAARKDELVPLVVAAREGAPAEIEGEVVGEEDTAVVPEEVEDEVSRAIALREQSVDPVMALPSAAEFNASMAIANRVAGTTFVPEAYRGRPNDVVAAILFGREIGLGPMTAMRDIHMIDGRPALAAHRQLALLRKGGVVILESETTRERAYIRAQRRDTGEIMAVEFTYEEAEKIRRRGKALIDGDNWRNYPADMLWARAVGRLTRRLGPDLLNGLPPYVAEEVADFSGWGVEYGAEGSVSVQNWASDRREETKYNFPATWVELTERMGNLLGVDEAREWMTQAIEAATGAEKSALTTEQRAVAFQKLCGILAALDNDVEGDLRIADRATIAGVFGRFLDGVLIDGPPWRLGPDEADRPDAPAPTPDPTRPEEAVVESESGGDVVVADADGKEIEF